MATPPPKSIDAHRTQGLTIAWEAGVVTRYSAAHLRRYSPAADARMLRDAIKKNPLTVLPGSGSGATPALLQIESVEPVGTYAIRIHFSDGHSSGIYTWSYLRSIDPAAIEAGADPNTA